MSRPPGVNYINLLQVTDCHLFEQADHRLMGLDTDESLDWVLELAAGLPAPDRILLTGDLAQDGSFAAYQRLREKIAQFDAPSSWLCGNHDHAGHMAQACSAEPLALQKRLVMGNWQMLMLDTRVEGEAGGYLADSELQLVEQSLQEFSGYSLICMHHHPLSINSRWMDRIAIANAEHLWKLLERESAGKVTLLNGHVHQQRDELHKGVRVLSTPSTCFQFSPQSDEFGVTEELPGLRMLQLYEDGSLSTQVHRIVERSLNIDRKLIGY